MNDKYWQVVGAQHVNPQWMPSSMFVNRDS